LQQNYWPSSLPAGQAGSIGYLPDRQAGNIRFRMYKVYVLYSKKATRFYTGFTKDIENRLKEHNSGKTKSTKAYSMGISVCRRMRNERNSKK